MTGEDKHHYMLCFIWSHRHLYLYLSCVKIYSCGATGSQDSTQKWKDISDILSRHLSLDTTWDRLSIYIMSDGIWNPVFTLASNMIFINILWTLGLWKFVLNGFRFRWCQLWMFQWLEAFSMKSERDFPARSHSCFSGVIVSLTHTRFFSRWLWAHPSVIGILIGSD